jgi:hypothetical protein
MTNPLGYYVDSNAALETLESEFGSTLQRLDTSEKLHLLGILAIREQQVENGNPASVYTVACAYQEHCFEGTAFSLVLAGLLIPSFTSTKPATVEPPKAVTANDEAVLTASKQTLQATEQNTALVVNDARAALLSQESARLSQVAAAQVQNPKSQDYRQKPEQVLDRLESEAIAQYQRASSARDWGTALAALTRVDAIDIARSGSNTTPEPKTSLTALALQTRLEKRQQVKAASADAIAQDVLSGGKKK